jgi:2-succinyl-6-hydroxy-2,4-cyclohexadiene-1-carboxylate synthase
MFAAQRESDPLRWQRVIDDRLSQRAHGLAASLRGSGQGRQAPLWEALERCAFPVLFAAGEKDERYAEAAVRVRRLLPEAEVQVLGGAGHDLLFDRETELAGMLRELWKRA